LPALLVTAAVLFLAGAVMKLLNQPKEKKAYLKTEDSVKIKASKIGFFGGGDNVRNKKAANEKQKDSSKGPSDNPWTAKDFEPRPSIVL